MRLGKSVSINSTSLYVLESTYIDGKRSTRVKEKLGTVAELEKTLNGQDPYEWAREHIAELTRKQKEENQNILIKYSPAKIIPKDEQRLFNAGYLVLQRIYHAAGLDKICDTIAERHKFKFNLDAILSRLVYSRIIYPSSKRATFQLSKRFIEQPDFDLHQIYRALTAIASEADFIQAQLYRKSILGLAPRHTGVLYYDCTNYFFEVEQEEGLKQYGYSKEHRPNPLVQMGLFLDADGIPLAYSITEGNKNEQVTLRPLEQQILSDFGVDEFVVCTDAGLSSLANRKFNDMGARSFVTTQPVKKLKDILKGWALFTEGWLLPGSDETYDLSGLHKGKDEEGYMDRERYWDAVFYKERWVSDDDLSQKLIVTFSLKYQHYQRRIREGQIGRAKDLIKNRPSKLKKSHQNDYKRFILKKSIADDGTEAKKTVLSIDDGRIADEEIYDGYYAVCTNLVDDAQRIIAINRRRWEIEESFRIMKHEFKARPAYVRRDDRIKAHFATCFIALFHFRYLEKLLGGQFTCEKIVSTLRGMDLLEAKGDGYIPAYTRTDLTDAIHDVLDARTDTQIVTKKKMREILKQSKKK